MFFGVNWTTRVGGIIHNNGFGSLINQRFKVININLPGPVRLSKQFFFLTCKQFLQQLLSGDIKINLYIQLRFAAIYQATN